MDAKACRKKGGIWDGRNKLCKPPKNIKVFAIMEGVPYGQYVHIIRATKKSQAFEFFDKHRVHKDYVRRPFPIEIKQIKTKGYPKYLFRGGSSD